ncbi:ATP-dependent RNA helicase DHX37 [Pyrus ussuriensis x Pyrus communis]|uniref:ATP-dependent RNA helicase DHX37 n=1 Tax=Pyrus ussuriensis x Pyrus communis TaxID=2448454 RepID=A0A5N5I7L9_9ROSA|nr:ATP-dependent RNA helicase DHX37 [Pyrus ussuriensis x Pyrus communis]
MFSILPIPSVASREELFANDIPSLTRAEVRSTWIQGVHAELNKIYILPKTAWDIEFKKWKLMVNKEEDPMVDWILPAHRDGTFVIAILESNVFTNVPSLCADRTSARGKDGTSFVKSSSREATEGTGAKLQ